MLVCSISILWLNSTAQRLSYDELSVKAGEYLSNGDVINSIIFFENAIKQAEIEFGKHDPIYATANTNIAFVLLNAHQYNKAEVFCNESLNLYKQFLGVDHEDYHLSLFNLSRLYRETSRFYEAEAICTELKNVYENQNNTQSIEYILALNNLSMVCEQLGKYNEAEELLSQSILITEKQGSEDEYYAILLNNSAKLNVTLGNYAKAEKLFNKAISICQKISIKNNPEHIFLQNLSYLYTTIGENKKSELISKQALDICINTHGKQSPEFFISALNLADIYWNTGRYDKASKLFNELSTLCKILYGKKHINYTYILNRKANIYQQKAKYWRATKMYERASKLTKNVIGENHINYAISVNYIADIQIVRNNIKKAAMLYTKSNNILNQQIQNNFAFQSDNEKANFIHTFINSFDKYLSFGLKHSYELPQFIGMLYDNIIAQKEIILQSAIDRHKKVQESNDSILKSTFSEMIRSRNLLTEQYSLTKEKQKLDIDSLENKINQLEKIIIRRSESLHFNRNQLNTSWQDIQEKLMPNEATIEFINFKCQDNNCADSIYYCALILRKADPHPQLVFLFEETQLMNLISHTEILTDEIEYIEPLYEITLNSISRSDSLFNLVWKPMENLLTNIKKIYISPYGLLHQISFGCLVYSDSTFVADKYNIRYVSNTKEILEKYDFRIDSTTSIVLLGGIKYASTNSSLEYLSGSLFEVNEIEKKLENKVAKISKYIGEFATEERFKLLSNTQPDIIHISTHGFYSSLKKEESSTKQLLFINETKKKSTYLELKEPLFRSGLLFADCQEAWTGHPKMLDKEDGILTAYEASHINLTNTKLVILSACETGLGDIYGYEGVIGLKRAFKISGVSHLLISLWKIPDAATSNLMQHLYTYLVEGDELEIAFKKAQLDIRKLYKSSYYWGAFVLY